MSGRIPWTRYSGDDIEMVIASFVCLENSKAVRIRPARGDYGIDLLVWKESDSVVVYQVKKFAENLGSGQKTQIKDSWNSLRNHLEETGLIVTEWHLVMPLDPTPGNLEWFESLTEGSNIKVFWDGLARVDAWASLYPSVTDYYLADGKQRFEDSLSQVLNLARLSDVTDPVELYGLIGSLQERLDSYDPHYAYSIEVSSKYEDGLPGVHSHKGLMMTQMMEMRGGGCLSIHVLAKHAAAAELSPIKMNVTVTANSDEEREQLREMVEYGSALSGVPATMDGLSINLPIDAGSPLGEGKLYSFKNHEPNVAISLSWMDLKQLELVTTSYSSGQKGLKWSARDRSGSLLLDGTLDADGKASITCRIESRGLKGSKPHDVLSTYGFIETVLGEKVDLLFDDMNTGSFVFDKSIIPAELVTSIIDFTKGLKVLSAESGEEVVFPDLDDITSADYTNLEKLREFVERGYEASTWNSWRTPADCGLVQVEGPMIAYAILPYEVSFIGKIYKCGLKKITVLIGQFEYVDESGEKYLKMTPSDSYGNECMIEFLRPDKDSVSRMERLWVALPPELSEWKGYIDQVS